MPLSRRLGHPMLLRERLWRLLSVSRPREMRDSEDIAIIAAFTLMDQLYSRGRADRTGRPRRRRAGSGRPYPDRANMSASFIGAQAGVEGWSMSDDAHVQVSCEAP